MGWPLSKQQNLTNESLELLDLYKPWIGRQTSNPIKLGLRLDQAYLALTPGKRAQFCGVLVEHGLLDEELEYYLKSTKGSLKRLTYVRTDSGTAAGA